MNESRANTSERIPILLPDRLDLEELWRIRSHLWSGPAARKPAPGQVPATIVLDLCLLREVSADAAFLLHEDLTVLADRGWRVRLLRASERIRTQLRRHPLGRFLCDDDKLFTDPDLDLGAGFRPSRH